MIYEAKELFQLAGEYCSLLSGGDIHNAIIYHAGKAEINLKYVNTRTIEITIVSNIFKAANAQGKIEKLIEVIKMDGFDISKSEERQQINISANIPYLKIINHISYLPTFLASGNLPIKLVNGHIINPCESHKRILIELSIDYFDDVVKEKFDIPPGYSRIPNLRSPLYRQNPSNLIPNSIVHATLNIDLFSFDTNGFIDNFQGTLFLSQPDIVLIASIDEDGRIADYSKLLSLWINSGAKGIDEFLLRLIPKSLRKKLGYLKKSYSYEQYSFVESQIRTIYNGLQEQNISYIPTESFGTENKMLIQRIRSPEFVINDKEIYFNCLDGSLLFASLLKRINIEPIIILLPQHALVGWKWATNDSSITEPAKLLQNCGVLDVSYLSDNYSFDAAKSAAEGFLIQHKELLLDKPKSLKKFASIINVEDYIDF